MLMFTSLMVIGWGKIKRVNGKRGEDRREKGDKKEALLI